MSLFGWWNDSDDVFDDDEDDIGNEWDVPEEEIDEAVDQIKGKVNTGDCIYCKAKDTMHYYGQGFFVCSHCGNIIDEDTYYQWMLGYGVNIVDDYGREFCDLHMKKSMMKVKYSFG